MNLPFIKAGVLIHENNKFLLVQEKARRVYGLWNFPSGKVEDDLNVQQTAIKEVKEETGFDIILEKELMVFKDTFPDTAELYVFLGKVAGGSLNIPEDEILDAQWFSFKDIELMKNKLVGEWIIQAARMGVVQVVLEYTKQARPGLIDHGSGSNGPAKSITPFSFYSA